MTNETRWELICAWAEDHGYHVELEDCAPHDEHVDRVQKLITINRKQSAFSRIVTLLHECGHILDWAQTHTLFFTANREENTLRGWGAALEQEMNAWRCGWGIAERLKLGINCKHYERHAAMWLRLYWEN